MPNLLRSLLSRDNATTPISITDWARMFRPGQQFTFNGQRQQAMSLATFNPGSSAYESNAIVYACEAKRVSVFSEARFQFQQLRDGRPGNLFGTRDLRILEEPWPGATTRDLLAVCELDIMKAGNSYWIRGTAGSATAATDDHLVWLDPAHVLILTEAYVDPVSGQRVGEQLLGYAYTGGDRNPDRWSTFTPQDVAHYKGKPNGRDRFKGTSWLSPCLPDVDADEQLTLHKRVQLRGGANLNYVVSMDAAVDADEFERFVAKFREEHEGPENAGKTLFLGGGADVKTIGQTFENLALKATQGAGETRIAADSGVPVVIVGLSEGLQGSSLNQGNYGSAKRAWADTEIRPMWGAWCGAFQWLVNTPTDSRLWYDDRDVAFLREDVTDQAQILSTDAQTIRTFIDAGFAPNDVIAAVGAGDPRRLLDTHSGLFSVQLQKPQPEVDDRAVAETIGLYVRAGFTGESAVAAATAGDPSLLEHTGRLPVTVQAPDDPAVP